MGIVFNRATGRYESTDKPPTRGYTKTAVAGGRGSAPTAADVQGLRTGATAQNVYSPRRAERLAATEAITDYGAPGPQDFTDEDFGVGGGGGVSVDAARRGGLRAAQIIGQAGRKAQRAYNQQGQALASMLEGVYNPAFAQQESGAEAQRKAMMDFITSRYGAGVQSAESQAQAARNFLEQQVAGSRGQIDAATQAALAAIPQQSQVYSSAPLVELSAGPNPLLDALAGYGAGSAAVQAQSAQDQALAGQLAQMARGSAGQLNQAQQAVLQAARTEASGMGAGAQRELELARLAQSLGIDTQRQATLDELLAGRQQGEMEAQTAYQRALADVAGGRAQSAADIATARQQLMSQGIEALLSGQTAAAQQQAETVAKYGPPKKTVKDNKGKDNKGKDKGKNRGKNKGGKK